MGLRARHEKASVEKPHLFAGAHEGVLA